MEGFPDSGSGLIMGDSATHGFYSILFLAWCLAAERARE